MATEYLAGNRLTLLHSGKEYFPALLAAIETASREIFLESYIYADDEIGHEVTGALCRAAARGVMVNVIVDLVAIISPPTSCPGCSPPTSAPCSTGRRSAASACAAIACVACTASWW
jgi:phosphatidylserine/phosphatidylglycerophosphate/cardiolipin synthase-like enzyme